MTDVQQLVERYLAAWNETDAAARRREIDGSWSADATYVDPLVSVAGRHAPEQKVTAPARATAGLEARRSSRPTPSPRRPRPATACADG
jgi:hypothetical protein